MLLQKISMLSLSLCAQNISSALNPQETRLRAKLKPHTFLKAKLEAGQRIYDGIHRPPKRKGTT